MLPSPLLPSVPRRASGRALHLQGSSWCGRWPRSPLGVWAEAPYRRRLVITEGPLECALHHGEGQGDCLRPFMSAWNCCCRLRSSSSASPPTAVKARLHPVTMGVFHSLLRGVQEMGGSRLRLQCTSAAQSGAARCDTRACSSACLRASSYTSE